MANPQPEPFVQFSKELFDAILRSPMPATQQRIVLAIVRRTYGDFGKKEAEISLGLLANLLGRDKGTISRALHDLVEKGVVAVTRAAHFRTPQVLALNKDYEDWGPYSTATVGAEPTVGHTPTVGGNQRDGRPEPLATVAPVQRNSCAGATIEDKSDTRAEEHPPLIPPPDPFADEFWPRWPNHHGSKQQARSRFRALTAPQQERCLTAERHLAAAVADGRLQVEYQPRAENFVGGSKQYYREWADGPPARYRSTGNGNASRSLSVDEILHSTFDGRLADGADFASAAVPTTFDIEGEVVDDD